MAFYMVWYPQALFTAEQACRRHFFFERHACFKTCPFLTSMCICLYLFCFGVFSKTPNRRGTQRHSKWRLNFVLGSHLDLMGDQNDVPQLSIFVIILCISSVFRTAPTYGTASGIRSVLTYGTASSSYMFCPLRCITSNSR